MKFVTFLCMLTVCAGSMLAQSAEFNANTIHRATPAPVETYAVTPEAGSEPAIINIFTLMGPNPVPNPTNLPCYDCVGGAGTPNLGILQPSGLIHRSVNYQVDVFLVDNTYTGSCTYTIEVVNKTSGVIVSTNPTFSETAPTTILLGTAFTIPSTAPLGPSSVTTSAVCGASTTKSSSPVFILK